MIDQRRTTAASAPEEWTWRTGDPDLTGWAIAALYLVAALAAFRAASGAPYARERWFWRIAAFVTLVLAVNKQLDLQVYVMDVGRCTARIGGWYDMRRSVQALAFAGAALVCLVTGIALVWAIRRSLRWLWPALLGLVLMAGFVLLRGGSFTHVEALMKIEVAGPLRIYRLIEMAGPILLLVGVRHAARARRHRRKGP